MKLIEIFFVLIIILYLSNVVGCGDDDIVRQPNLQPPIIFPGVTVSPSSTMASLKGYIDPRGNTTTYACEYGNNLDLEQISNEGSIGNGFGPVEITIELDSLLSGFQYYYRWRASNIGGTTFGKVDSFTTLTYNFPPDTWLSAEPPDSTVAGYNIHLYWSGFDIDGIIAYFEWQRIDEGIPTPWFRTTHHDSVFVIDFSFTLDWQFFVRAVDAEGTVDPTPASYVFSR